jgi:hypothetical protein
MIMHPEDSDIDSEYTGYKSVEEYAKAYKTVPATVKDLIAMADVCIAESFHGGVVEQAMSISRYDFISAMRYLEFCRVKRHDRNYDNRRLGTSPPVLSIPYGD